MFVPFEILGFWKFSRNCLTSIQSRQATHTIFVHFLGFYEELPDGELGVARRPITYWSLNYFGKIDNGCAEDTNYYN